MKVDELIGSLQTFETVISDKSEKKNKGITFVSTSEKGEDRGEKLSDAINNTYQKKVQQILEKAG